MIKIYFDVVTEPIPKLYETLMKRVIRQAVSEAYPNHRFEVNVTICDDEETLNEYFSKMREIFIDIRDKKLDNKDICILSMGMSGDYEAAVRNGSNLVRVGSAIFGPRIY